MRPHPAIMSQAGATLIEAVIAAAIIGVVALGLSRMQSNSFASMKHYEVEGAREDLKNHFRQVFDTAACAKTLVAVNPPILLAPVVPYTPNAVCGSGTTLPASKLIVIRDGFNNPIVRRTPPYTKIGEFEVRARCSYVANTGYIFGIEALWVDASNTPRKDPVTGTTSTWTNLFADVPLACEIKQSHLEFKAAEHVPNFVYYGHYYNDVSNFVVNPGWNNNGQPSDDPATLKKLCEYMGMRSPARMVTSTWASPCGNTDVHWDVATAAWVAVSSCPPNPNIMVGQLWCTP